MRAARLRRRQAVRKSLIIKLRDSAESAKLNDAVRQLESEKVAAEGKARRMEFVAYGLGVIALLAIVSSILFASRKKAVQ